MGNYLYGALTTGGAENKGALFRIKTDGSDYSIVHNFNGLDGERPYAGVFPYAGSLFGGEPAWAVSVWLWNDLKLNAWDKSLRR